MKHEVSEKIPHKKRCYVSPSESISREIAKNVFFIYTLSGYGMYISSVHKFPPNFRIFIYILATETNKVLPVAEK